MLVLIAGCSAPPPLPAPPEGAPPGFPSAALSRLASTTASAFVVDPSVSLLQVLVYRGGALARMGHDHVIAARDVNGIVVVDPGSARRSRVAGEFYTALATLSVDEPALRSAAGFATEPSAEDRQGTRRNMLATFDAAAHPFVRLDLEAELDGDTGGGGRTVAAEAVIALAGATRRYPIDVTISGAEAVVVATGRFSIRHSDFGVEPFSVLGGALAVQDRIDIEFEIHALARQPGAPTAY